MSGIYQSDRTNLIVEKFVQMGPSTQTELEKALFEDETTAEILGPDQATREKINSWVAVYFTRMRKKGVIVEVGVAPIPAQKGHAPAKMWNLAYHKCPYCGHDQPNRDNS